MSSSPSSVLDVVLCPGRPPMLQIEAPADPPGWAAQHRDVVRAAVAEQGSLLIRGLGLRDAAGFSVVVQSVAAGLMSEREAFAPRGPGPGGGGAAAGGPAGQQGG